ncbi:MAG: signal peptidase II [Candidatus Gracilibacteria bacterium]
MNKRTLKITALIFGFSAAAVLFDQLSKLLVTRFFPELIYKNSGIAFSMPVPAYASIVIAVFLVIAGIFAAYRFLDLSKKLAIFAVSLVIGGAVGNVIDRLISGQVTDFISVWIWPVFNLADSFITIGILAIIIFYDKIKRA